MKRSHFIQLNLPTVNQISMKQISLKHISGVNFYNQIIYLKKNCLFTMLTNMLFYSYIIVLHTWSKVLFNLKSVHFQCDTWKRTFWYSISCSYMTQVVSTKANQVINKINSQENLYNFVTLHINCLDYKRNLYDTFLYIYIPLSRNLRQK